MNACLNTNALNFHSALMHFYSFTNHLHQYMMHWYNLNMGLHPSVLKSLWNGHLDNGKDKKRCLFLLGLHDILHAICMRITSVKPVPWLAVNLHHLFSNGAVFNTQSRRSLTSYAYIAFNIACDTSAILSANCVACQWSTALCIKYRSIWKQVMEINR